MIIRNRIMGLRQIFYKKEKIIHNTNKEIGMDFLLKIVIYSDESILEITYVIHRLLSLNTDFEFIPSYSIKLLILKFIIGVDDLQKRI